MIWIPLIIALILPWLANPRRRGSLILSVITCYALILLAVYLHHIDLQQQLHAATGGQEFFPPTPETDALVAKLGHDTARRLAPITALLPAILYPLLVNLIKRRRHTQP
ncbi:MAG: hypothetical protein Q4D61_04375 [Cardiobacteriaceae bacterium]|nr:hypothetical protein [Cardiobacteriaceae bacterium]